MQVNFNPSAKQIRPNFKANFSKGPTTKFMGEMMTVFSPDVMLASELALRDIPNKTMVLLDAENSARTDIASVYFAKVNNRKTVLGTPIEDASEKLLNSICNGELLGESPRASKEEYLNQARVLIESFKGEKGLKEAKLSSQILALQNKLKELHSQLSKLKLENKTKVVENISKQMFKVVK